MTDLQANLHNHSEHSHLDGYANVEAIATRAKELGQSAIALTDHGECSGHIAFYKACRRHDIHPILGMEGYWLNDIAQKKDVSNSHITLLAQNQQGLSNLWTLSSIAYQREYFYRKPLMDADLLRTYADGIYASDGCLMTDLSRAVVEGREDAARQYLANLHGIFRDRFYMELHTWQFMDPQTDDQRRLNGEMAAVNQAKVRFATEMGIPLVVVNDSHHARPEDWENKDLVWKFNTGNKNPDQLLQGEGQKADHIMGSEEIIGWMARHGVRRSIVEEAIRNSADIARACNVEIRPTLDLPRYSATDHDDMVAFLDLVEEGFRRKVEGGGLDVPTYFARMESESRLICDKGFCGYFLVVHDYVKAAKSGRWAQYVTDGKRQPIQVGAGRGSGGGSLVAWLLDITSIDPIRHNLLFERFLSPSRQGYPDIDTDFPRSHRPNMRAYLEARYGHDHVCTIGTTIRNSPKGMVRDLGRAYGLSYTDTEAISKIIVEAAALVADEIEETGEEVSWEVVLAEKGGDLKPWVQSHPELFQRLGEMVGIARQSGVHPSGILVNNSPLMGKVPLRTRKHGKPDEVTTTQFSMDEIENDLGGVKFDLLGIRHLDTLDHFRDLVRERHGRDIDFDTLTEEELSDPILWGRIDQGRTTGIFQVETPGSTRVAKELHPRNVSDLAALVSIVRPGVKDAGLTDAFLRRRMGEEPVTYDHPLMEPIVSSTYGILVYQEQVMRASRDLALFSAEEADGLRKVTAKKKADEIGQWEDKFIDGCLANPAFSSATDKPRAAAQRIWVSINASARYSFNYSHAVAYATLANWEVFAFAHYEPEMLVALMQTDPPAVPRYVREARRSGITVLPPDINLSGQKFTIVGDTIRYGIDTVRGVGPAAIKIILKARPFTSFEDYLSRVSGFGVSKTVVVNLIILGAFDSLGDRRDLLLRYQRHRILAAVSPNRLATMSPDELDALVAKKLTDRPDEWEIPIPDFSDPAVVGAIEEELLGSLVTVDPMAPYARALEATAISHPDEINQVPVGDTFDVGGQVTKVKEHTIQKQGRSFGRKMAFLSMSWNEEEFEVVAFPDTWDRVRVLVVPGSPVLCRAKRTDRGATLEGIYRLDLLFDEAPA